MSGIFKKAPCLRLLIPVVFMLVLPCFAIEYSAPISEPGLMNRDDLLTFEDFERKEWYYSLQTGMAPTSCTIVSDPVYAGTKALRVRVKEGGHMATDMKMSIYGYLSNKGLPTNVMPEELYFRYYLRFGDNWRCSGIVGKLPGISGTYGNVGMGGVKPNGYDGWSARLQNNDNGATMELAFYCYHPEMPGTWGDVMKWGKQMEREKWYCVESYAKMNSITGGQGNHDGVLRSWIDGQMVYERTNMRFRDTTSVEIKEAWFDIYVGGSWTAPQDMDVYFDNIVVATGEEIGTYDNPSSINTRLVLRTASRTAGLKVYDLRGRLIKSLSSDAKPVNQAACIFFALPSGSGNGTRLLNAGRQP